MNNENILCRLSNVLYWSIEYNEYGKHRVERKLQIYVKVNYVGNTIAARMYTLIEEKREEYIFISLSSSKIFKRHILSHYCTLYVNVFCAHVSYNTHPKLCLVNVQVSPLVQNWWKWNILYSIISEAACRFCVIYSPVRSDRSFSSWELFLIKFW